MTDIACPYVGLSPYTESEQDFFCGREHDQETIAANLMTTPLSILYGACGVGKTSVLQAGVVPFLRRLPGVVPIVFREWKGEEFLRALKNAIAGAVLKQTGSDCSPEGVSPEGPLDELLCRASKTSGGTIVLIFDQFEDYFLYHARADGSRRFDREFARSVNGSDIDANFLISIREDSVSLLDHFQARIPNVLANCLRLEHLDRDGAIRAIQEPLTQYNKARAPEEKVTIKDDLVKEIVEQVQTGRVGITPGGHGKTVQPEQAKDLPRIETAYLQLVLERLWREESRNWRKPQTAERELRLDTLKRLGGAADIVRTHLDESMGTLSAAEQETAARVFHFLVTPSGTKIAHRVADLAEYAKVKPEELTPVLEKLSAQSLRVLHPVSAVRGQPPFYEIFHDVLAPAILDWRLRYLRRQERAAADKKFETERKKVKGLTATTVVLLVLIAVIVALGWFWLREREKSVVAGEQARLATIQAGTATRDAAQQRAVNASHQVLASARVQLPVDPELSVLLAVEAAKIARTEQAEEVLREALTNSHTQYVVRSPKALRPQWAVFNPEGTKIIAGLYLEKSITDEFEEVWVWDAATGRREKRINTNNNQAWKELRVWNPSTAAPSSAAAWLNNYSEEDKRGPNDAWRVHSSGQIIEITKTGTNEVIARQELDAIEELGAIVVLSPDRTKVAAGGSKATYIYDAPALRLRHMLKGQNRIVLAPTFSADGATLVTPSFDGTACIWHVPTGDLMMSLIGHTGPVLMSVLSRDGSKAVTASLDGTWRLWSVGPPPISPAQARAAWRSSTTMVRDAEPVSPDGTLVVTWNHDMMPDLSIRNRAGGSVRTKLVGHTHDVHGGVFSRDGARVLTVSEDNTARVWDVATGRCLAVLAGHSIEVTSAAFSPDGKFAVTTSKDQTVRVWHIASGKGTILVWGVKADAAVFSPDGKAVVIRTEGNQLRGYGCEFCGSLDDLLGLAGVRSARSGRTLSPEERERYLPPAGAPSPRRPS